MEPVPCNGERKRKKRGEREKDRGASVISRVPGSCVRAPGLMNSVGSRLVDNERRLGLQLKASPLSRFHFFSIRIAGVSRDRSTGNSKIKGILFSTPIFRFFDPSRGGIVWIKKGTQSVP